MGGISTFEKLAAGYDRWFEDHWSAYQSELAALKKMLPENGIGMEGGVGTGRFATALGIEVGVEPSKAMRKIARRRTINAMEGVAEALPFSSECFDHVLFVTTVCFVDSMGAAFKEAFRVLKPGGAVVIGFIDRNSFLGRQYEAGKNRSRFYREAVFRSVDEVVSHLEQAGFYSFRFVQTIFRTPAEISAVEPVREGYGEGAFVVAKALKPLLRIDASSP
jgi:ubiquinone/menaquinone biosynthesis C-methylase UbiE